LHAIETKTTKGEFHVLIYEMATANPALLIHLTLLRSCCLSAKLLNTNFKARRPSSAVLKHPLPHKQMKQPANKLQPV